MRVFLRNTCTRLACHDGGGHSLRAEQKRAIIALTQNAASCPMFHEGVDYQSKKRDEQDCKMSMPGKRTAVLAGLCIRNSRIRLCVWRHR